MPKQRDGGPFEHGKPVSFTKPLPDRPGKQFDASGAPKGAFVWKLLHPREVALITYLRAMRFGRVERLEVQDGLPVAAEESLGKVRFDKEARPDARP